MKITALVLGWFIIGASPLQIVPLRFEVTSVKPSRPNAPSSLDSSPGRFIARSQPLSNVIALAYNLATPDNIVSAPTWVQSERWDIEAKVEDGSIPTRVDRTD